MYKRILVAIDLNDKTGWENPLMAAAEHARKFKAEQLTVLTVVREVEAIIYAEMGPLAYEMIAADFEHKLAARVRDVNAYDCTPKLMVAHGESIYDEILRVAEESNVDLIIVGSHRPAMKDYLLGTNAGRIVRHAKCSVLVAREIQ